MPPAQGEHLTPGSHAARLLAASCAEPLSLSELCVRAEIGLTGSVTRNLDLLAVRGLIDVCPATTGRAKQLYTLTRSGETELDVLFGENA